MEGIQGNEAIEQGTVEQEISQQRTAELSGQQQVSETAQGIDVKSGTALATKQQTGDIGALDYLTIGNNAALKSLGFQMDATADNASGQMAKLGGNFKAGQSAYQGTVEMFTDTMKGLNEEQNSLYANDNSLFPPTSSPTPTGGIPYTGTEAQGGMPGLQ